MLSTGMDCKLLTTYNQMVQYVNGSTSTDRMHVYADGAGVIPHPTDGGWYYVSNSEGGSGKGGVGTIRFNSARDVIGIWVELLGIAEEVRDLIAS